MGVVSLVNVGRKNYYYCVLYIVIFIFQLGCFIYSFLSPYKAAQQDIEASVCAVAKNNHSDEFNIWYTKESCEKLVDLDKVATDWPDNFELVFMMEMPKYDLNFSRWEQTLLGQLQIDSSYHENFTVEEPIMDLTMDARLAYSQKLPLGNRTKWKHYAHSEITRYIPLTFYKDVDYPDSVGFMHLFELGSLDHDFYLLNIRLPHFSQGINKLNMTLHIMYMNKAYTQGWINMKSAFFVLVTIILIRFFYHVKASKTPPSQVTYMLYATGLALLFCDLPLDYFRLYLEMPFMLAVNTLRQGLFYAMLSLFWLIFVKEHILIGDESFTKNNEPLLKYLFIIIICFSLPILIFCEHVVQIINPFNTIMFTEVGNSFTLVFTFISVIGFCIYGIIMAYTTWLVFRNIGARQFKLPGWYEFNLQQYGRIVFRIKCIMISIIIFAELTAIYFISTQVMKFMNGWNENMLLYLKNSSVLDAGIIEGMWDLHVCSILLLYTSNYNQASIIVGEGNGVKKVEISNYNTIITTDTSDKYPLLSSVIIYNGK